LKRCLERDESPCLVDEIALGGKRHAHAVRSFSVRQIAEAHDPQGEPRPALVAQLMLLDEAGHRHIMGLAGKHRRAHHIGAELGIGKAEREGERRAADRKPKWCGTERKAKPERSEDKCDGHTGLWLILWSVKRAMMPPANKTGARRTSGLLPSRARGRPQQEP